MPKVSDLVGQIKGMNQDAPRDSLPKGTVWNLHDILPSSRGANLRGRGQWIFRSTVFPGATSYPDVGIFANFPNLVSKLLFVANDGNLYDVDPNAADLTDAALVGMACRSAQNPVQHRFRVIVPNYDGNAPGKVITNAGAFAIASLPASALTGRFATVFKDRTILGNAVGKEQQVAFSKPGDPTAEWDPISIINTSLPLTGVAALRGSVLCFHRGSMERLRGTTPPDSTLSNQTGDMVLEPFPERIGCSSPRFIAYWRENVVWADERGIYMTDGSVTTNLATTGGISRAWKKLWEYNPAIMSATMYGDFYVISMYLGAEPVTYDERSGQPSPDPQSPPLSNRAFTLVCDLPTRAWFTMGNFNAATYVATQGAGGEKLFLGDHLNRRVVDLTNSFEPSNSLTTSRIDGDGFRVNPILETGWSRLGPAGQKRAVMIYPGYNLAYEAGQPAPPQVKIEMNTFLAAPESIQWIELPKKARANPEYVRARIPVRRMHDGFAFRFSILNDYTDFNLFEVGFEGFSVEQMRVHKAA